MLPDPLLGEDANTDGVRDDIGEYIDNVPLPEPLERDAVRQYARAARTELASPLTKEAAIAAASQIFRAMECLDYVQGSARYDDSVIREVKARTLDTRERSEAYLDHEALIGGMHYAFASAAKAHLACDFDTSTLRATP